jgi:PPOX class probable F420-dependent enzyme
VCYALGVAIDGGGVASGPAPAAAAPATVIWTPIDEKPKETADPLSLARVRDVLARPTVSLLVDRWDEDWSRLAWVRLDGTASILVPARLPADGAGTVSPALGDRADRGPDESPAPDVSEHAAAVAALRARYPQYDNQALEVRPVIRIAVDHVTGWWAASPAS